MMDRSAMAFGDGDEEGEALVLSRIQSGRAEWGCSALTCFVSMLSSFLFCSGCGRRVEIFGGEVG